MKTNKLPFGNNSKYIALVLLALILTGCASYVSPGENPATLQANVQAMVSQVRVDAAKNYSFRGVTGPYWVWNVYIVQSNGYHQGLMPAGKAPRRWVEGNSLKDNAAFSVPAGNYQVRLKVTAYMDYEERSDGNYSIRSVPLAEWNEDIMIEAKPGGSISLDRRFEG